jgi:5-methylcytosine-specific restriction endonuclease McrA
MPTAPRSACLRPGCPGYAVSNGRGYCEQDRKSEAERGYGRVHRMDRRVNRPGATCERCGAMSNLQRDHRIPHSLGGGEEPANKRWLCRPCHDAVGVRSSARTTQP